MLCSLVRIFCRSQNTFFAATAHISKNILFLAVKKSEKEKERAIYTYAKRYIYVHKLVILEIYIIFIPHEDRIIHTSMYNQYKFYNVILFIIIDY